MIAADGQRKVQLSSEVEYDRQLRFVSPKGVAADSEVISCSRA
jgi:hypothetical protein